MGRQTETLTISIHSTARVETLRRTARAGELRISIHFTARVETVEITAQTYFIIYFNPLHREGGDVGNACSTPHFAIDFNPLHREGGDVT